MSVNVVRFFRKHLLGDCYWQKKKEIKEAGKR